MIRRRIDEGYGYDSEREDQIPLTNDFDDIDNFELESDDLLTNLRFSSQEDNMETALKSTNKEKSKIDMDLSNSNDIV